MRVASGAISHETSTFTTVPTTWESFSEVWGDVRGPAIIETFRGGNIPTGGFISGAEAHGFELIPTIHAAANPSAPTPRDVFEDIVQELLDGIEQAGDIDGVLLELHGAMVAEGVDDAEGYILNATRQLVGPNVPIVAQLDIHSNVSPRMVENADVLIGRETYPEIDMAERGRECADVLVRIVREGLRPTMALRQLPMFWGLNQVTAHPPMNEAIARLHALEAEPGVVCGSIATCFPWADIPDMGSSVYVVTDDDIDLAQQLADDLGEWIFERRADWHSPTATTRDRLAEADGAGKFPTIIADYLDNTGGGTPGDSTGMLQTFLDAKLDSACVLYVVDPGAIAKCVEAGVGAVLDLEVGGKSVPAQGTPCPMRAEVIAVSDGEFEYDGPMFAGMPGNMGASAHIRQDGVHVILVTIREQPFCTAFSRTLGLDPRKMKYIGVKSQTHFRSGFESWAGGIYVVAEPSVHNPVDGSLVYRNLGRKLYPLDDI